MQEKARLLGVAHVGLGNDLHQRHPGPVEVDHAVGRVGDVPQVQKLAGVLLQVDLTDAHPPGLAVHVHVHVPAHAHGVKVLGDLVALR